MYELLVPIIYTCIGCGTYSYSGCGLRHSLVLCCLPLSRLQFTTFDCGLSAFIKYLCRRWRRNGRSYEHFTTSAFFEDWFEHELIPLLPPNALVIMDNASFHRKQVLYITVARYDMRLLFLPPYSPNFNPIEHSWANFKFWLRNNSWRFPCFDFAIENYFYPLQY